VFSHRLRHLQPFLDGQAVHTAHLYQIYVESFISHIGLAFCSVVRRCLPELRFRFMPKGIEIWLASEWSLNQIGLVSDHHLVGYHLLLMLKLGFHPVESGSQPVCLQAVVFPTASGGVG